VVDPFAGDAGAPHEWAEDECRDMASAATQVVLVALVEDDEDDAARAELRQDAVD
jgi:hypothetical protein